MTMHWSRGMAIAFVLMTAPAINSEVTMPNRAEVPLEIQQRLKANPAFVRELQRRLKDKGYDPGVINGEYTVQTEDALRDFQGREGLPATGLPDVETVKRLKL